MSNREKQTISFNAGTIDAAGLAPQSAQPEPNCPQLWRRGRRFVRAVNLALSAGNQERVKQLRLSVAGTLHNLVIEKHPEGSPLAGQPYGVLYLNNQKAHAVACDPVQQLYHDDGSKLDAKHFDADEFLGKPFRRA